MCGDMGKGLPARWERRKGQILQFLMEEKNSKLRSQGEREDRDQSNYGVRNTGRVTRPRDTTLRDGTKAERNPPIVALSGRAALRGHERVLLRFRWKQTEILREADISSRGNSV